MPVVPDMPLLTALLTVNAVALRVVMPFLNGFIVELMACAFMFVWWFERRPQFAARVTMAVTGVVAVASVSYIPMTVLQDRYGWGDADRKSVV